MVNAIDRGLLGTEADVRVAARAFERDSFSFLLSGRRDYDEASNETNADAFTADKRPVVA